MKTLRHFDIAQCKLHSVRGFFFCISFILLFTSLSFPQSVRDEIKKIGGSPAYTGSWTPANLPIDTTSTSVYFYGEASKTKVAKDSGGVSVRPYMRVWSDYAGEVITNNTFDTDTVGWVRSATPTTFEWVANGGGFTGAIHSIGNSNNDGVQFTEDEFDGLVGTFNLSFDINIITTTATGIRVRIFDDSEYILNDTIAGTGSSNYENTINVNYSGLITLFLNIMQIGTGASEFYIDNVYLTPALNDSVYGYTYTIPRPPDTTIYYYSQSVKWVQKDKDTIWVYADADTATVYPCDITPTQFVFTDITNAEINTQYTSDSIIVAGLTCETTLTVDAIQPLVSSEYQINDGIWVSDEVVGVVDNGDEIKIKATTVGSYNGSIDIVASVNSVEDTLTITTKADNINYMRTADGDTMFTAEGDTMKTSYNFNFNKTNGEKNEEDIILPQRVYAVLDSKRTMGFTV